MFYREQIFTSYNTLKYYVFICYVWTGKNTTLWFKKKSSRIHILQFFNETIWQTVHICCQWISQSINQSVYQWFHFNQSVYQCIVWIEIKPIINHILGRKQKADWSKIRSCLLFWIMNLAWYIMIRHIRHTWAEFCSNVMTGRLHHDAGEGWGYTLPLLWIILSIKHVWYLGNIGHVSHHGIRLIYIV